MAWTYTYDVNTPAGTDDPKEGDNRIREIKAALQERLANDHYFPKTGSQVSDPNAGLHKKVTLIVGSAPSVVADRGYIYVKDVDSIAELFYRDEDGDEVQLTVGGKINIALVDANVVAYQANITGEYYNGQAEAAVNALLTKLKASGVMASS